MRKDARWCSKCTNKPADAVNVTARRCECRAAQPTYGKPGGVSKDARWCSKCPNKPTDAVNVVSPRCECHAAQPSLGKPGWAPKDARWCSKCPNKPADAVNVTTRRCKCRRAIPIFGKPGGAPKDARWCSACPTKPADAVNVANRRCECRVSYPTLGKPGGAPKDALWCSACPTKPADAVNVANRRCECKASQPSFGKPGGTLKDALWCSVCPSKPTDAVNVKNSPCGEEGCETLATFAPPGQHPSRCAVHKASGMIFLPRKRCQAAACRELGTHLEGGGKKRRFCETHAPEGSTDFVQRLCAACGLMEVIGPDGRCASCDPVRRAAYLKAKELEVKAWLDAAGIPYTSHDKMVDGGECVKYRPDFLIYVNGGVYALVLEVDEMQHGHYECELVRMLNISQALAVPTVFLRFNPDGYKPVAGKAVPLESRREPFLRWIRRLLSPDGDGNPALRGNFCEVRKLFFDGCDGQATPVSIGPRLTADK